VPRCEDKTCRRFRYGGHQHAPAFHEYEKNRTPAIRRQKGDEVGGRGVRHYLVGLPSAPSSAILSTSRVRHDRRPPRQKCPDRFRFGHFLFGGNLSFGQVPSFLDISFNTSFNTWLARFAVECGEWIGLPLVGSPSGFKVNISIAFHKPS
jgi:hypothetical protein